MVSVASPKTQASALQNSISENQTAPPETFIFRSKLPDITIHNHLPLHEYCFQNLLEYSDRTCLINGANDKTYTFTETELLCRKTAVGLSKLGVKKGDVIMLILQNCPEFVFSFLGASMIGVVTTTANPFYTSAETFKQLKASNAKLIITQCQYVNKLNFTNLENPHEFSIITIDGSIKSPESIEKTMHFSSILDNSGEIEHVSIDGDDPIILPFSSGTTGLPKGVILTHRNLVTDVAQQVDGENPNLYLTSKDVALCVLPLFHTFSLNSILLCSIRAGAGVLLMQKFEMAALLELIPRYKVTVAALVPPLVLALAKNPAVEGFDLSSIRIVLSGAAPLGKELEEALLRRLPQATFGQGYGMTEAGPVLSMSLGFAKKPYPTKSGSCGTVVRNAELKVIDPQTGFSLPRNQRGEICIRGPQIMKGYLNNAAATASTIDMEGWLHTGDIGYVDEDDEIYIVDRLKELIKFKGFQVPPAELEALLVGHPLIKDAAVVPQEDEVAGEVPVAFVVGSTELTEAVVKEFIAKQVVFYKRLHKVYFVNAIPKSPTGKILRKDLRAKLVASSQTSS